MRPLDAWLTHADSAALGDVGAAASRPEGDRWHHLVCAALGWHRPGAQRRQRRRTDRVPRRGVQPL